MGLGPRERHEQVRKVTGSVVRTEGHAQRIKYPGIADTAQEFIMTAVCLALTAYSSGPEVGLGLFAISGTRAGLETSRQFGPGPPWALEN